MKTINKSYKNKGTKEIDNDIAGNGGETPTIPLQGPLSDLKRVYIKGQTKAGKSQ